MGLSSQPPVAHIFTNTISQASLQAPMKKLCQLLSPLPKHNLQLIKVIRALKLSDGKTLLQGGGWAQLPAILCFVRVVY